MSDVHCIGRYTSNTEHEDPAMITNTTRANFNAATGTVTDNTDADPPPSKTITIAGDAVVVRAPDGMVLSVIPMGMLLMLAQTRAVHESNNAADRVLWSEKITATPDGPLNVELVVMSTAETVATRIGLAFGAPHLMGANNLSYTASSCFSQPSVDGNNKRLCDVRVTYMDEGNKRYINIFVIQYVEGEMPSGPENPIKSIGESVINKPFIPCYHPGIVIPQTVREGEHGITVLCSAFRQAVTTIDNKDGPYRQCIASADQIEVPFMEFLMQYRMATEGRFRVGEDGNVKTFTCFGPSALVMMRQMLEHQSFVDTIDMPVTNPAGPRGTVDCF